MGAAKSDRSRMIVVRAETTAELDDLVSGVVAKAKVLAMPVDRAFVASALVAATCNLFDRLSHPVTYLGPFARTDAGHDGASERDETRWVVIDLAGNVVQGAVAVGIPEQVALGTHPMKGATGADRDSIQDWSCEMTNLLVGAFKNELLRAGAVVYLSVPRLLGDPWAELTADEIHRFSIERDGCVDVVLEAEVDTRVELVAPAEAPIECGSVLFLEEE